MLVNNASPVGAVSKADLVGFTVALCQQFDSCEIGGIDRFRQVCFDRGKAAAVIESHCAVKESDSFTRVNQRSVRLPAHYLVTEGVPFQSLAFGIERNQGMAAAAVSVRVFHWLSFTRFSEISGTSLDEKSPIQWAPDSVTLTLKSTFIYCFQSDCGELLNDYLDKILRGQPINYEAFLKKLPDSFRRRHRELFAAEKVKTNRWLVTILDERAFAKLQDVAQTPVSRLDAAKKGNSHRHGTEVSFLLVYHQGLASSRPDVAVIGTESVDMGFRRARSVLVVENERNFYQYSQMLGFASETLGTFLDLAECDVVLGGGNRVTRGAILEWLMGYEEVFCAFDYDAGGLQMFSTIVASLGDKATFVQPADWQPWLARFRNIPDTTERFTRAISLAEGLGFVALAEAFRSTGKFMEQEMILDE
ncbi:hypothetical protein EDB94_2641 [Marinobacter sp. 3-2]|jgi:hypothetical protein|nr:hypothetical protein EDB94_2641 [Marinobacter sp. 3-2]